MSVMSVMCSSDGFSPRETANPALINPRAASPNKAKPTIVVIALTSSDRKKLLLFDVTTPAPTLMPPDTRASTISGMTASSSQVPMSS